MPRGNGMGPRGCGPMTGRGAGFCAGYDVPGYANGGGRGFGGRGFGGRGFGGRQRTRGALPTESMDGEEKAFLENRVAILARELDYAKGRLAELTAPKET